MSAVVARSSSGSSLCTLVFFKRRKPPRRAQVREGSRKSRVIWNWWLSTRRKPLAKVEGHRVGSP
jgi:hypothetical protein